MYLWMEHSSRKFAFLYSSFDVAIPSFSEGRYCNIEKYYFSMLLSKTTFMGYNEDITS